MRQSRLLVVVVCVVALVWMPTSATAKVAGLKSNREPTTEQQVTEDLSKDWSKALVPSGVVIGANSKCCQCRNRCPTGPPGPCPSVKPATNAQCGGAGGVRIKCPDGDSVTICNGAPGADGPPGLNGTCPANCTGTPGPQGPPGFNGTQGPQGERGFNGTQGPQGERGFNGTQGPQGERGFNGTQGPQGERGFNGTQGPQGERGFNGTQGPQGERGFNGTQGPCPTFGDVGIAPDCESQSGFNASCNGVDKLICIPAISIQLRDFAHIAFATGREVGVSISDNIAIWSSAAGQTTGVDLYQYVEIGFGGRTILIPNENGLTALDGDFVTFQTESWTLAYDASIRDLSAEVDVFRLTRGDEFLGPFNMTIRVALYYAANFTAPSTAPLVYFPTTLAVDIVVNTTFSVTPALQHYRGITTGNEFFVAQTRFVLIVAILPPSDFNSTGIGAEARLEGRVSAGLGFERI